MKLVNSNIQTLRLSNGKTVTKKELESNSDFYIKEHGLLNYFEMAAKTKKKYLKDMSPQSEEEGNEEGTE